ncbi:MAG: GntR family transcriptional regulator [Lentisphaeria bacterium]
MPLTPKPTYNSRAVRLAQQLRVEVQRGRFLPGEQLPAERELAERYGVSRSTIRHALELLTADHSLAKTPRRGVKVPVTAAGTPAGNTLVSWVTLSLSADADEYTRGLHAALDPDYTLGVYCAHANIAYYGKLVDKVAALCPAGIVLEGSLPSRQPLYNFTTLAASGIPVVIIGEDAPSEFDCDRVISARFHSSQKVGRYLVRKNYRDITLLTILDPYSLPPMLRGLRSALRPAGIALPDDRVFHFQAPRGLGQSPDPYIDAQEFMDGLIRDGLRRGTVVADHDYPAVGFLRAILAAGIRVPEEMQVISIARCHVEGATPLRLTTVDDHREELGSVAGNVLRHRLADPAVRPGIHHIVSSKLVEGETG